MAYRDSTTNGGNSTTPSVAVPAGVQSGDIVVLAVTLDGPTAVVQSGDWPTGFVELQHGSSTVDGQVAAIGWKRLSGADSGSYTFGVVDTVARDWLCQAYAFSGRHDTDPPVGTLATNNVNNANPVSVIASGVTAVTGDDLLWVSAPDVSAVGLGNLHTPPSTYTEAEDVEDASGWCNLSGAYKENVSSGATGSITGTFATTSTGAGWIAFLVRIPVAVAGGPDLVAMGLPLFFFLAAAGGASVALTGQAGTGAIGTLTPNITVALTGVSATASAGTLSHTAAIGLSGQAATGTIGTVTPATTRALTGFAATGAIGTVAPIQSLTLSGVTGTGFVGSLAPTTIVNLSGVAGTGAIGIVTVSGGGDVTLALSGVSATGGVGSLAPNTAVAATGVAGTGAVGTLGVAHSQALTGTNATGAVGTLGVLHAQALTGNAGTGAVGTLGVSHGQALTGVAATGVVGTMTASVAGAVYPTVGDVRLGITYGPTGADYTGTMTGGGGPQIIND